MFYILESRLNKLRAFDAFTEFGCLEAERPILSMQILKITVIEIRG